MTADQQVITESLLRGCFLRKKINHANRHGYTLYTKDCSPIKFFKEKTLDSFVKNLPSKIFKTDRHRKMTFNLTVVRQLHGNSFIKKQYKIIKHEHSNHSTK
jgi:hypothetical protein